MDLSHYMDELRSGPLSKICVLDLTQSLAGPYCTQLLADLGATVIKVEPPEIGDVTRATGPFHPDDSERQHGGYFHSINRNKRSIAVNLKTEEGRAIIKRLVKQADVLVENYKNGTMERFGLSYEVLAEENDQLIYAALRGFGDPRSGVSPHADWPTYDVVAQAMGGISGVTGPDPDSPTKIGPGIGDIVPGVFLAIGLLAALVDRQTSGKGQFVDVGMVDVMLAISERIVYQKFFSGETARPPGNHQPFMAPFGIYRAKNGHVAICAPTDVFFEILCRALDVPELCTDERFHTREARRVHRLEVIDALSQVTARFTKQELMERLGGKVPFGPVYDMDDIVADDHFRQRNMLAELDLPGLDTPVAVAGQPIKHSAYPELKMRPAPGLGADTDSVLSAGGYTAEEVATLRKAGVVQ